MPLYVYMLLLYYMLVLFLLSAASYCTVYLFIILIYIAATLNLFCYYVLVLLQLPVQVILFTVQFCLIYSKWFSFSLYLLVSYNNYKVYFKCRAGLRCARTFPSSTAQIDVWNHFFDVLEQAVLNAFERRAARLSTTSARRLKWKRRSVDVIIPCKLEKMEKYFFVNWDIIID